MGFDTHRGTVEAVNALLGRADLVLVLGAHLGHNGTSGHHLKFDPASTLHVDSDTAVLGRVCPAEACVCLPVEDFLARLAACDLRRSEWSTPELAAARQAISTPVARAAEPEIAGMSASSFFAMLRTALPRDAMLVTDTGMHQVMTRRHLPVLSPGGLLIPSDFQSMGFGLPAMIAAKLALPQRPVVGLMGDGGMSMSGMELATAAQLGLTLPIMVFDDGKLNQIRLHQESAFGSGHGVDLPDVDFEALAAATGVRLRGGGDGPASGPCCGARGSRADAAAGPGGDSFGVRRVRATAFAKATLRRSLPEQPGSPLAAPEVITTRYTGRREEDRHMLPLLLDSSRVRNVLCLGAHCDDIEIGAGGSLMELSERLPNAHFRWVVFSGDDEREAETRAAAARVHRNVSYSVEVLRIRGSYFPSEYVAAQGRDRVREAWARRRT